MLPEEDKGPKTKSSAMDDKEMVEVEDNSLVHSPEVHTKDDQFLLAKQEQETAKGVKMEERHVEPQSALQDFHPREGDDEDEDSNAASTTTRTITGQQHPAPDGGSSGSGSGSGSSSSSMTWTGRAAANMARHPWKHLLGAWLVTIGLSVLGMVVGDFTVTVDNQGWRSRGTLIANRHIQQLLVLIAWPELFAKDNGAAWDDYLTNVQPTWENLDTTPKGRRRNLEDVAATVVGNAERQQQPPATAASALFAQQRGARRPKRAMGVTTNMNVFNTTYAAGETGETSSSFDGRFLQTGDIGGLLPGLTGCESPRRYTTVPMAHDWWARLWPVWKMRDDSVSALDPRVIHDICVAEQNTQRTLENANLCFGCDDNKCLPPYSLVFYARMSVGDLDFALSCDELSRKWINNQEGATAALVRCVQDIKTRWKPLSCPLILLASLMEKLGDLNFAQSCNEPSAKFEKPEEGATDELVRCVQDIKTTWKEFEALPLSCPLFLVESLVDRLVDLSFALSRDELCATWESTQEGAADALMRCVKDVTKWKESEALPLSCPFFFNPTLVDESFGEVMDDGSINTMVRTTSSVFATVDSYNAYGLYDAKDGYDRASDSEVVEGAYDTQYGHFNRILVDKSLVSDMLLACGSAVVTSFAILVHTRSAWLTVMGLFQIILSFPLAYFLYNIVLGLQFFPSLNFMGVFVVFALGADDIFVAVDKWKNARLDHKYATTEQVAAIALPDAAKSMFLTTLTTAVAFFGTAICPVAPMRMFAIFNGLLVTFDYFLCVLLVFPAICLYDKWTQQGTNRCVSCNSRHQLAARGQDDEDDEEDDEKQRLIRRILTRFYYGLHFARWGLLVAVTVGIVLSGYFASNLTQQNSSGVRLLSDKYEEEKNYVWRQNLLVTVLSKQKEGGSRGYVIWGVAPADTGNYNNPEESSTLVLDGSFDPSSEASQKYILGFCDDFFAQDFASRVTQNDECIMNRFDAWLQEEWLKKKTNATEQSPVYASNCAGATGVPVPSSSFDACMIGWSQSEWTGWVFQKDGVVEIILFRFQSRVRVDSKFEVLDKEWKTIESWMSDQSATAPLGVAHMYFSSEPFWWYDTNGSIFRTAYGAAGIALGAAAIVMLVSSRSIEIMFFSLFTIGFILLSVTAMLVERSGWTLGFLESICFAILIGVSCDFVIHFGHAYSSLPGDRSRHERSKYAILRMGPSILAGFLTTVAAAVVMLFTVNSFFQKFATLLFYTVLMATASSFVVFIALSDTLGPSQPTLLVDSVLAKFCNNTSTASEDKETEEIGDSSKPNNLAAC